MSKIDRMMIQGIRSFGPEKGETIQFTAPLTLIVGWNGSGKTTWSYAFDASRSRSFDTWFRTPTGW